jgi:cobalt-zinc-cadmium efflux system membrane fusion protein
VPQFFTAPRRELVPIALAICVLAGCHRHAQPTVEATPDEPVVRRGDRIEVHAGSALRSRLRIAPVEYRSIRRSLEAPAQVDADPARMARITPPLPGRVLQLFVHFGDTVTPGQRLLTLDSPDLVAAQTDYLRARTTLAQAERTLSRNRDLAAQGAGSEREVEQASTERDVAQSELERAMLRLRLLHTDPGAVGRPLTVPSPIAGRVVEFHVAPGEFHDADDQLITIADLSTIWVTANVQEKDIRRVHAHEDASATFAAYPGEHWTGQVLFVGDLLDPDTRTIQVRVAFANDDRRLRPGMFANVTFTETAAPELVVPTTAIVLIGDASYVFVETAPWTFERRRITPGAQIEGASEIASGIREGERVVVENAVLLQ